MAAQHGHSGHAPATSDTRALVISGVLTGGYLVIEWVVGVLTGTVAVIPDAFHTFSTIGGVLVALVASAFTQRGPTRFQTYGWIRAEIIGALFNGLFLAGMALVVFWMGAMRLMEPIDLPTTAMLLVALGGLVTEAISFRLLYGRQKENLNIKGAFWHILQALVGSFIVIASALVIRFTGFLAIDPLLGMAFGIVLLWASWRIIRDSLQILLQGTPKDLDLNAVVDAIGGVRGVKGIHNILAWSLPRDGTSLRATYK
jgi:cobalt-zinc-cadmium efflux system protein